VISSVKKGLIAEIFKIIFLPLYDYEYYKVPADQVSASSATPVKSYPLNKDSSVSKTLQGVDFS